jgi:hypothetical protein
VQLGADYMPVRTPVRQTLLTDRAARGRVDVRREGDALVVQNALGTALDAFVYQAVDGQLWKSTGRVADGATAQLERCEDLAAAGRVDLIVPETSTGSGTRLFDGSYAARLADCTFVDHMGADPRDVDSTHLLVGILSSSEAP